MRCYGKNAKDIIPALEGYFCWYYIKAKLDKSNKLSAFLTLIRFDSNNTNKKKPKQDFSFESLAYNPENYTTMAKCSMLPEIGCKT